MCLLKIDAIDVAAAHIGALADLASRRVEYGGTVTAVGWPAGGEMGARSSERQGDRRHAAERGALSDRRPRATRNKWRPGFDASGFVIGLENGGISAGERVFFTALFNIRELLSQSPNGCAAEPSSEPPFEVTSTFDWSDLRSRLRTWHPAPGDLRSRLASLSALGDLKISNATVKLPKTASARTLSARTLELDNGSIDTGGRDLQIEIIDLISDSGEVETGKGADALERRRNSP